MVSSLAYVEKLCACTNIFDELCGQHLLKTDIVGRLDPAPNVPVCYMEAWDMLYRFKPCLKFNTEQHSVNMHRPGLITCTILQHCNFVNQLLKRDKPSSIDNTQ